MGAAGKIHNFSSSTWAHARIYVCTRHCFKWFMNVENFPLTFSPLHFSWAAVMENTENTLTGRSRVVCDVLKVRIHVSEWKVFAQKISSLHNLNSPSILPDSVSTKKIPYDNSKFFLSSSHRWDIPDIFHKVHTSAREFSFSSLSKRSTMKMLIIWNFNEENCCRRKSQLSMEGRLGPETKFERVEISPRERETEREAHTRDDDDDDKEQGMYAENGKYTRRILCGKK